LQDLKDRRVGWYGEASGGGTAFYVVGLKNGINVKKDLKLIESSPPALWPLLDRGEVDGIVIYEPFVSRMLATTQYRSILGPFWQEWKRYTGLELEMTGLAASREWYDKNPDKVKKIISVWKEASEYIKGNINEVIRKYPDLTELRNAAEIQLAVKSIPPIYATEWDSLDVSIEIMLKMLAQDSVLIKNYPANMIQKADTK
jgi:NitT/TauT family transport system substrate-binding protein